MNESEAKEFTDRWGESHTVRIVRNGDTFDVIADGVTVFEDMCGGKDEEDFAVAEIEYFADLIAP